MTTTKNIIKSNFRRVVFTGAALAMLVSAGIAVNTNGASADGGHIPAHPYTEYRIENSGADFTTMDAWLNNVVYEARVVSVNEDGQHEHGPITRAVESGDSGAKANVSNGGPSSGKYSGNTNVNSADGGLYQVGQAANVCPELDTNVLMCDPQTGFVRPANGQHPVAERETGFYTVHGRRSLYEVHYNADTGVTTFAGYIPDGFPRSHCRGARQLTHRPGLRYGEAPANKEDNE